MRVADGFPDMLDVVNVGGGAGCDPLLAGSAILDRILGSDEGRDEADHNEASIFLEPVEYLVADVSRTWTERVAATCSVSNPSSGRGAGRRGRGPGAAGRGGGGGGAGAGRGAGAASC